MVRVVLPILCLLAALFVLPSVAHGQEVPTPTPTPPAAAAPAAPVFDLGGLQHGLSDSLWTAINDGLPTLMRRLLVAAFGALARFIWDAAGGALAGANIFTQLPPAWSYELGPVVQMRALLQPVGYGILSLAVVLAVGTVGVGMVIGRPFGAVFSIIPRFFVVSAALLFAPQLIRGWIDFSNLASARLLDPEAGLPGMNRARGLEHAEGMGVVALVYLAVGVLFFLSRIKLLILTALVIVTAPLAIAAGALPFGMASRFFSWWLSTLLAATFVQVLQAVCLGLGAALIAAPAAGGSALTGSMAEGVMSMAMGVGAIIAAMSLPGMLLGALGRAEIGGRLLDTAFKVAMLASGVGTAAGVATIASAATASRGAAAVSQLASVAASAPAQMTGYTTSLLGNSRPQLLLPPPRG